MHTFVAQNFRSAQHATLVIDWHALLVDHRRGALLPPLRVSRLQYFNNAYYAKVGGVPCNEMNSLELEFLFSVNFTLHVTTDVFEKYYIELANHMGVGVPPELMTHNACECARYAEAIAYSADELMHTGMRSSEQMAAETMQALLAAQQAAAGAVGGAGAAGGLPGAGAGMIVEDDDAAVAAAAAGMGAVALGGGGAAAGAGGGYGGAGVGGGAAPHTAEDDVPMAAASDGHRMSDKDFDAEGFGRPAVAAAFASSSSGHEFSGCSGRLAATLGGPGAMSSGSSSSCGYDGAGRRQVSDLDSVRANDCGSSSAGQEAGRRRLQLDALRRHGAAAHARGFAGSDSAGEASQRHAGSYFGHDRL